MLLTMWSVESHTEVQGRTYVQNRTLPTIPWWSSLAVLLSALVPVGAPSSRQHSSSAVLLVGASPLSYGSGPGPGGSLDRSWFQGQRVVRTREASGVGG